MPDAAGSRKESHKRKDHAKAAGSSTKDGPAARSRSKADRVAPAPKRSAGVTATSAGGFGGLSVLATPLEEPYRSIFVAACPALATLSARFAPVLLDWAVERLTAISRRHTARRAVQELEKYVRASHKRLEDSSLTEANRAEILKSVEEVQGQITRQLLEACR